jgi:hypothetical protein
MDRETGFMQSREVREDRKGKQEVLLCLSSRLCDFA